MQCPQCQHDNSATARFCEECGRLLRARCPACGFEPAPSAKFCPECGQRLAPPAPATASPVAFTPSQAYTPPHLAEKIRLAKSVLEGERKQVTVLFADLKGSMELLADRDPEEARADPRSGARAPDGRRAPL